MLSSKSHYEPLWYLFLNFSMIIFSLELTLSEYNGRKCDHCDPQTNFVVSIFIPGPSSF